jgi:hypothetical protein
MIVGNGYAKGHAAVALQTLRDHPPLHRYFDACYGGRNDRPSSQPTPAGTGSRLTERAS